MKTIIFGTYLLICQQYDMSMNYKPITATIEVPVGSMWAGERYANPEELKEIVMNLYNENGIKMKCEVKEKELTNSGPCCQQLWSDCDGSIPICNFPPGRPTYCEYSKPVSVCIPDQKQENLK